VSLFYDRDRNVSGVDLLTGLTYSPEYGSSVRFEARNSYLLSSDKVQSIAPLGLNSIVGGFSLNFSLRESDAQKLVNFYESQSGTGIFAFNDSSSIYRTQSGTIDSLGQLNSSNNGKYGVSLSFAVERNAPVLDWSGQSFVNYEFRKWQTGQSYEKYDILWFQHDMEEPINNWFYSLSNHTSSIANHPLSTGLKWTTNLFEDSNEAFSISQTPTVKKTELKNSFVQRVNEQRNIHAFDSIDISYQNISDKKTKALLHFAESKLGYKRFEYQFPEIYNKSKLFVCSSWDHKWNAKESNNITLSLMEDPLGIKEVGFPSILLTQQSGRPSLSISVTGSDYCFYQTGNLKQLISVSPLTVSWGNTGQPNTLKLFGPIVGLTGTGQSLIKSKYDVVKDLTHLNMSGNSISVANMYFAPNLVDFNYANNNVGGFDLRDKPNLRKIQIQNNNATYFGIGNSSGVTGIYATGNSISGYYVGETFGTLYSGGLFSGFANFSGNGEISNSSYPFATGLTGRAWNLGYGYNPYQETTTTPEPAGSPVIYTGNFDAGLDAYSACNSPSSAEFITNWTDLTGITKVNYSNNYLSGQSVFYLSDGVVYYGFNKSCCGKAVLASTGACVLAVSTTAAPTTSTTEMPTSTTEEPEVTTTTTERPTCFDPDALNFLLEGPCVYA